MLSGEAVLARRSSAAFLRPVDNESRLGNTKTMPRQRGCLYINTCPTSAEGIVGNCSSLRRKHAVLFHITTTVRFLSWKWTIIFRKKKRKWGFNFPVYSFRKKLRTTKFRPNYRCTTPPLMKYGRILTSCRPTPLPLDSLWISSSQFLKRFAFWTESGEKKHRFWKFQISMRALKKARFFFWEINTKNYQEESILG